MILKINIMIVIKKNHNKCDNTKEKENRKEIKKKTIHVKQKQKQIRNWENKTPPPPKKKKKKNKAGLVINWICIHLSL